MITFLKEPYKTTFNRLYELTEGRIILGGSASLKYQNIIERDVEDIDVNILHDDWVLYESRLSKDFKFYYIKTINNPILGFNSHNYTVLSKKIDCSFDLFVHFIDNFYFINNGIRLLKSDFILKDKLWILETEPNLTKHLKDVEHIKNWINGK